MEDFTKHLSNWNIYPGVWRAELGILIDEIKSKEYIDNIDEYKFLGLGIYSFTHEESEFLIFRFPSEDLVRNVYIGNGDYSSDIIVKNRYLSGLIIIRNQFDQSYGYISGNV